MTHRIRCAWCGEVVRMGSEPESHGICVRCAEALWSDHDGDDIDGETEEDHDASA